jgi:chorismate mutase/prephenate dehydratase
MSLDDLRSQLDTIDNQMMALLAQRASLILQVAELKKHHDIPVHVPERENAIMARLRSLNPGPLNGDAIERIYRTIIDEMRKLEDEHIVHESS